MLRLFNLKPNTNSFQAYGSFQAIMTTIRKYYVKSNVNEVWVENDIGEIIATDSFKNTNNLLKACGLTIADIE